MADSKIRDETRREISFMMSVNFYFVIFIERDGVGLNKEGTIHSGRYSAGLLIQCWRLRTGRGECIVWLTVGI